MEEKDKRRQTRRQLGSPAIYSPAICRCANVPSSFAEARPSFRTRHKRGRQDSRAKTKTKKDKTKAKRQRQRQRKKRKRKRQRQDSAPFPELLPSSKTGQRERKRRFRASNKTTDSRQTQGSSKTSWTNVKDKTR